MLGPLLVEHVQTASPYSRIPPTSLRGRSIVVNAPFSRRPNQQLGVLDALQRAAMFSLQAPALEPEFGPDTENLSPEQQSELLQRVAAARLQAAYGLASAGYSVTPKPLPFWDELDSDVAEKEAVQGNPTFREEGTSTEYAVVDASDVAVGELVELLQEVRRDAAGASFTDGESRASGAKPGFGQVDYDEDEVSPFLLWLSC